MGDETAKRSSIYGGCLDPRVLADEERIVWLDDPAKYPYLRETTALRNTRGGRIAIPGRKVVAYAVLVYSFSFRYLNLFPEERELRFAPPRRHEQEEELVLTESY